MNNSRLAAKVGFFVAMGLIVLALLFMTFSKGLSLFTKNYEIKLQASSVGGLKKNAAVLLSGVTIGNVVDTEIPVDGKGVILRLKIQEKYKIHNDARFAIEQIGFLGDQYVAIYPTKNEGPLIEAGAVVKAEEPLNIGEMVRSASGLLQGVGQTVKVLNESMARLDRTIFSDNTLSNITVTMANFRKVSEKAIVIADDADRLIISNTNAINQALTNMVLFSQDLSRLTDEISAVFKTNGVELTKAVNNLERTSMVLERLAKDVESGRGVAGALIKNQAFADQLASAVSHLDTASSNIARFGLLYKPKQPKPPSSNKGPVYPGKNPIGP
jgi:phospholipid/cholesterol/gamma-HCH transport system substrate-binding protein